jgi:tRNA threonylcarbamoyladenosine biosynthesis protein TsaE
VSGGTVHTAVTSSEDETVALGEALSRQLRPGDVVTLDGPLGAGKTRFVRGMAIGLGHDPAQVSSPTFVVAHEYATPGARAILIHVDAYRLSGDDDSALGIG